jgi:hypothetical protein
MIGSVSGVGNSKKIGRAYIIGAVRVQALIESPCFVKLEHLYLGLSKLWRAQQEALREWFGDRVSF